MADLVGWAGTVVFILAAIFVAHKNITGIYLMMVGNILFGVVGYMTGLTSLIGVSSIMVAADLYGIFMWSKQ